VGAEEYIQTRKEGDMKMARGVPTKEIAPVRSILGGGEAQATLVQATSIEITKKDPSR